MAGSQCYPNVFTTTCKED